MLKMNAGGIILCTLLLANIDDHVMIEMEHVLKIYIMQQDMVSLDLTLVVKEKLSCTVECHALGLTMKKLKIRNLTFLALHTL